MIHVLDFPSPDPSGTLQGGGRPPLAPPMPTYGLDTWGGEGESLKRVLHSTALYRSSVILRAGWMEEG